MSPYQNLPKDAIVTWSGKIFRPLDPDPAQIDIADIAHSLSNQCRWTGHTKGAYSTAQHSVLVSEVCGEEDALWGLLHDSPEVYISDIARPVKRGTEWGEGYEAIEEELMFAVAKAFDLPYPAPLPGKLPPLPLSVKTADDVLLYTEMRDLMPEGLYEACAPAGQEVLPYVLEVWEHHDAELRFLERYFEIVEG